MEVRKREGGRRVGVRKREGGRRVEVRKREGERRVEYVRERLEGGWRYRVEIRERGG